MGNYSRILSHSLTLALPLVQFSSHVDLSLLIHSSVDATSPPTSSLSHQLTCYARALSLSFSLSVSLVFSYFFSVYLIVLHSYLNRFLRSFVNPTRTNWFFAHFDPIEKLFVPLNGD